MLVDALERDRVGEDLPDADRIDNPLRGSFPRIGLGATPTSSRTRVTSSSGSGFKDVLDLQRSPAVDEQARLIRGLHRRTPRASKR